MIVTMTQPTPIPTDRHIARGRHRESTGRAVHPRRRPRGPVHAGWCAGPDGDSDVHRIVETRSDEP